MAVHFSRGKSGLAVFATVPAAFTLNAGTPFLRRSPSKEIKRSLVDFAGGFPEWRPLILSLSLRVFFPRVSTRYLAYPRGRTTSIERRTFSKARREASPVVLFFRRLLVFVQSSGEQVSLLPARREPGEPRRLNATRATYVRQRNFSLSFFFFFSFFFFSFFSTGPVQLIREKRARLISKERN